MAKTEKVETKVQAEERKERKVRALVARVSGGVYLESRNGNVRVSLDEDGSFRYETGKGRLVTNVDSEEVVRRLVAYKEPWIDKLTVFGAESIRDRGIMETNERKVARIQLRGLPELRLEDPSEWVLPLDVPTEESVKRNGKRTAGGNREKAREGAKPRKGSGRKSKPKANGEPKAKSKPKPKGSGKEYPAIPDGPGAVPKTEEIEPGTYEVGEGYAVLLERDADGTDTFTALYKGEPVDAYPLPHKVIRKIFKYHASKRRSGYELDHSGKQLISKVVSE